MRYSFMAERDIRAHIRRAGGETTNSFVAQRAALIASVRLWAQVCKKTDTDVRRAIESADEGSLPDVAEELVDKGDADAWTAGRKSSVGVPAAGLCGVEDRPVPAIPA